MTKVDLFSGFLGAGKTTLIKKLLGEGIYEGEKVVLIENEFGEVGIDGGFLRDSNIEISELNQGCICCSMSGDFTLNMRKVMDEYHPDRIIVEPSGVAGLSDVEKAIEAVGENYEFEIVSRVVVVNALRAKKQMKGFGEFFNNQVENASTIVLSRTKDIDEAVLDECVALLKEKNSKATIITTDWEALPAKVIMAAIKKDQLLTEKDVHHHGDDCTCGCHDHDHEHHHHDHDHDHEHEHHHHDHDHDHEHHHHDHDHDHEHHHDHDHDHEHEHHHHDHGDDCTCGCHDHDHEGHHHHHHADDVFTSIGIETPHKFEMAALEQALKAIANDEKYETILRAKGIVQMTDGSWTQFDMVPGEYEIREGSADYTSRLCVIGTTVSEADVKALFGIC